MYKQGRPYTSVPDISSTTITGEVEASAATGGHKIVHIAVGIATVASSATVDNKLLAMTLGAVSSAGDMLPILICGLHTEPSWAWTPGPIYLGIAGAITQTPSFPFFVELGYAIDSTTIYFNPEMPIIGS